MTTTTTTSKRATSKRTSKQATATTTTKGAYDAAARRSASKRNYKGRAVRATTIIRHYHNRHNGNAAWLILKKAGYELETWIEDAIGGRYHIKIMIPTNAHCEKIFNLLYDIDTKDTMAYHTPTRQY